MDGGCDVWRNKNNLKFFDILNKIEFTINSLNVGFFEKLLGKMEKLSFYTKISTNIFFYSVVNEPVWSIFVCPLPYKETILVFFFFFERVGQY